MGWLGKLIGQIIAAVIIAAIIYFTGGAAAGFWNLFARVLATSLVSTFLLEQLADDAGDTSDPGYKSNVRSSKAPHAWIYGETRVGGVIIYEEATSSNKYLHRIIALAAHEVESIGEIFVNGVTILESMPHKNNKLIITKHLGTADQVADPTMVAASAGKWTSAHKLSGIAYIYVRMEFDRDTYPQGIPTFTAVVKGRKLFDLRKPTEAPAWSANAALCIMDYLVSHPQLKITQADINIASFTKAANDCDELVSYRNPRGTIGMEKRYEFNSAFTSNIIPRTQLIAMKTCTSGTLWYGRGQYHLAAGVWRPPVHTFTQSDLRNFLTVQTSTPSRQQFNVISGVFRGRLTNWVTGDYPTVKLRNIALKDELSTRINLPFVTTPSAAQRIARLLMAKALEPISFIATFSLAAYKITPGDVIYITHPRYGWDKKTFEVNNWTLAGGPDNALLVELSLRETSEAVFSWDPATDQNDFHLNNTSLPDPFQVGDITIAISGELRTIHEQATGVLIVDVSTMDNPHIATYEVEARETGTTDWIALGSGGQGRYEMVDISDNAYDVRARGTNLLGVQSAWNTRLNHGISLFAKPPETPTDFRASVVEGALYMTWEASPDKDLSFYRIWHHQDPNGSVGSAIEIVNKVPRPATSITVPSMSGKYFLRAFDKLGHSSGDAELSIIAPDLLGLIEAKTTDDADDFTGQRINNLGDTTLVTAGDPDGTLRQSFTNATDSGPYTNSYNSRRSDATTVRPAGIVDLGQVRSARVAANYDGILLDGRTTALFDTTPGTFDMRQGLFDDGAQIGMMGARVDSFLMVTNDDPALIAATWQSIAQPFAGEYTARAFSIRTRFTSTIKEVTIGIQRFGVSVYLMERTVSEMNLTTTTAPLKVTFKDPFYSLSGISISPVNLLSGEVYQLADQSATGFTIQFLNSDTQFIARSFNYTATGAA